VFVVTIEMGEVFFAFVAVFDFWVMSSMSSFLEVLCDWNQSRWTHRSLRRHAGANFKLTCWVAVATYCTFSPTEHKLTRKRQQRKYRHHKTLLACLSYITHNKKRMVRFSTSLCLLLLTSVASGFVSQTKPAFLPRQSTELQVAPTMVIY
jgi:hypothetical protein